MNYYLITYDPDSQVQDGLFTFITLNDAIQYIKEDVKDCWALTDFLPEGYVVRQFKQVSMIEANGFVS